MPIHVLAAGVKSHIDFHCPRWRLDNDLDLGKTGLKFSRASNMFERVLNIRELIRNTRRGES
jgi:hypothetical protein